MRETLRALRRRITPDAIRPYHYFEWLVRRRARQTVARGPFAGMRYVNFSIGSAYIPKLAGSYERELSSVIDDIISSDPRLIVDVGAAEGYYAVGLARSLPKARVIAFETEERGRSAIGEMAELNGVSDRIRIRGTCEPEHLKVAIGDAKDVAVIVDVEGYEDVLLDPVAIPELKRATILVELHEFAVPHIVDSIASRFEKTHDLELIWQECRGPEDIPWQTSIGRLLPAKHARRALDEFRSLRMCWYYARPKAS